MKLLLLGGTVFLGRHIAAYALERGHRVTLFHRGQQNPQLFPEAEKLYGDRDGDLKALQAGRWDAVIDTSGYVPRVVGDSARLLADRCDHYAFISSISVYADVREAGADESQPVGQLGDETVEEIDGETYGPLKALCEKVVADAYPEGALIIRPGLIVGPHDPTDRFSYWPHRIALGGEVLAPGSPRHPVQVIDVRDLAQWTVRAVEQRTTGVYNATGPDGSLDLGSLFDACRDAAGSRATFTWVSEEFLLEHGVAPWTEIPLWMPRSSGSDGLMQVSIERAVGAGLTFRPLSETVADTLEWLAEPGDRDWKAGMNSERERELLALWRTPSPRST